MKDSICVWCSKTISVVQVLERHEKRENGTIFERRCPGCGKVLAAYLEEEGEFFKKIRTF